MPDPASETPWEPIEDGEGTEAEMLKAAGRFRGLPLNRKCIKPRHLHGSFRR